MNTDQQILELVKTEKFTLPMSIVRHFGKWIVDTEENLAIAVPDQAAHDLCAMHFARQECKMERSPLRDDHYDNFAHALARGESELAIRILFDHFGA